ncbi:amidase [Nitratireductor sp. ZSWI3]|uniref:amidase n=1 Tax=Nitratireductor sp. ZSWI3 TaxID=2966359 RepID=UPI00214FCFD5|nr:amidase [Nitratireductor sp. ZSWI3]MCR4266640.1 amidase [Nitratireductor sp. ZSWI3]
MQGLPSLPVLANSLAEGLMTSRQLLEACLERIDDDPLAAAATFTRVDQARARRDADEQDRMRREGREASPFAGIPFTAKDLFDVTGEVTRAGSAARAGRPPAHSDALAVHRLRMAGLVLLGRTNMTEFAYSGLGLNPHFGTPPNHWNDANDHAPGGSSSGGATAVRLGLADLALGTDTGGSCRIPAAFQGLVGFKPTAASVPAYGVVPLSPSLDSIGPIARSVACCAASWRILAKQSMPNGNTDPPVAPTAIVPEDVVLDDLDAKVAADFDRALARLSARGWHIVHRRLPVLADIVTANRNGGFPAFESWRLHGAFVETNADRIDPRVASRIRRGAQFSRADAAKLVALRKRVVRESRELAAGVDAFVWPTVAITPPSFAELEDDEAYDRLNALALRNTGFINFMDGCAISLPMHEPGSAPTGLMLSMASKSDERLLALAARVEEYLRRV